MNISEFLEARIAEDEKQAQSAGGAEQRWGAMTEETGNGENIYYTVELAGAIDTTIADMASTQRIGREQAEHIARHDPSRVLAQCAANRAVVRMHGDMNSDFASENVPSICEVCHDYYRHDAEYWPCPTLRALAAVYKDHPDYRDEWRLDP